MSVWLEIFPPHFELLFLVVPMPMGSLPALSNPVSEVPVKIWCLV